MLKKALIVSGLLSIAAPVAFAQVIISGGGLGKDCYDAAKYDRIQAKDAERICSNALQFETLNTKNRAATYTNRGIIRMRQGRYDSALSDYAASKRMNASNGATWLNEGAAYIYKKQFAQALVSLDKSVELETQDMYAAHYNRGIARENTGDVQGAYADFTKALELKPDFEQARFQLERFTVVNN